MENQDQRPDNDRLLTRKQAAQYMGLKPSTLADWATDGSGPPFIKLGPSQQARVRYRKCELDSWIKNYCGLSAGSP